VAWSPHPARFIQGIQGRYFTPLLILLGFGIFNQRLSPIARQCGAVALFLLMAVTTVGLTRALLNSYWIFEPGHNATLPLVQHSTCQGIVVDVWFNLRSQDPCKRTGLLVSAKLMDSSGTRELCPRK
jgi:hypothetical protein